jgi:hypothetical protein
MNSIEEFQNKIIQLMQGCGFENAYRDICGKTLNKEMDRRYKYPVYLCQTCLQKISKVKRDIRLVQEGEEGEWKEELEWLQGFQKNVLKYYKFQNAEYNQRIEKRIALLRRRLKRKK